MLDLRRLRLLREFRLRGSIAATAAALGYTPSAVSQQLAALEREAGAPLLDRTARSAELTDAGRTLAAYADQILDLVERAETDLSAQSSDPTGRVVVSAFPTASVAFAPTLARSLHDHPALSLSLRQTGPGEGLPLVRSGEVDIALIDDWRGRLATRDDGVLRFFHLMRDPLVLIVPPDHRLADPDARLNLRRLREDSWLATPAGEPSRQAVDRMLAEVGGALPVPWEFEGLNTILGLVARGIGIAAVPTLALAGGEPDIVVRRLPDATLARDVYAVVRGSSVRRPSVSAVLQAIHAAAAATELGRRRHRSRGPARRRRGAQRRQE